MKTILALITLICFSASVNATEDLNGYIVMANRDTVKCKFPIKSLRKYSPFYEVRVIMENGEEQTYRRGDNKILGYGFRELGIAYDFWYIEMKQKSESGFYQQLINGPKYKLYTHVLISSTYPGVSMQHPQYVVFNQEGDFVKFETCLACPWKKQLRNLLKDDTKALELLESSAERNKIPEFVAAINKE